MFSWALRPCPETTQLQDTNRCPMLPQPPASFNCRHWKILIVVRHFRACWLLYGELPPGYKFPLAKRPGFYRIHRQRREKVCPSGTRAARSGAGSRPRSRVCSGKIFKDASSSSFAFVQVLQRNSFSAALRLCVRKAVFSYQSGSRGISPLPIGFDSRVFCSAVKMVLAISVFRVTFNKQACSLKCCWRGPSPAPGGVSGANRHARCAP